MHLVFIAVIVLLCTGSLLSTWDTPCSDYKWPWHCLRFMFYIKLQDDGEVSFDCSQYWRDIASQTIGQKSKPVQTLTWICSDILLARNSHSKTKRFLESKSPVFHWKHQKGHSFEIKKAAINTLGENRSKKCLYKFCSLPLSCQPNAAVAGTAHPWDDTWGWDGPGRRTKPSVFPPPWSSVCLSVFKRIYAPKSRAKQIHSMMHKMITVFLGIASDFWYWDGLWVEVFYSQE